MINLKIKKTIKSVAIPTVGIAAALFVVASLAPSPASADWMGVIELENPTGHATDQEWVDSTGYFSIAPATATSRQAATFATNGHLRITLVNNGVVLADETVNGRGRLQFLVSGAWIGGTQSLLLTAVNDARDFIPVYQNHDVPAGSQVIVDIKGNYRFVASDRVLTSTTFDDGVTIKSDGAGTLKFTVEAQPAPKSL
jgi:hypothetical protein